MPEKKKNRFPLLVLFLSISVQLWVLFYLFNPAIYFYKYWELALRLRGVLLPPIEVFYSSPFYIGFLAISQIMGLNYLNIQIIQVLLGAFNCWLIYRAGILFFNRPVGIIASLTAVFYGPFIIYNSSFLPAVWVITFNLIFLISIGEYARGRKFGWLIIAGIFIGLSIITRPNIAIFLFLLIPSVLWRECLRCAKVPKVVRSTWLSPPSMPGEATTFNFFIRHSFSDGGRHLRHFRHFFFFLLLIPTVLIVLPVAGFNYLRSGELIPVTASGGWVFYCGNNERVKGFDFNPPPELNDRISAYYARPGNGKLSYLEHLFSRELAREKSGDRLNHRESSSFWFKEGIQFIRRHPGIYLKLLGKKFLASINGYEAHDVPEVMARAEELSHYPLIGFAIIFPLALLGFFIARPRSAGMILYLYLISDLLSFLLMYIIPRFRLPMVPVLLLFAAAAVMGIYDNIHNKQWKVLIRNLIILIPLAILVNISTPDIDRDRQIVRPAFIHEWKGLTYMKRGEWKKAGKEFRRALKLNPGSYQASRGLELSEYRDQKMEE